MRLKWKRSARGMLGIVTSVFCLAPSASAVGVDELFADPNYAANFNLKNPHIRALQMASIFSGKHSVRAGAANPALLAQDSGYGTLLISVPVSGVPKAAYSSLVNRINVRVKSPRPSHANCGGKTAQACCVEAPEVECASAMVLSRSDSHPLRSVISAAFLRDLVAIELQEIAIPLSGVSAGKRLQNDAVYFLLSQPGTGNNEEVLLKADTAALRAALALLTDVYHLEWKASATRQIAGQVAYCANGGVGFDTPPASLRWRALPTGGEEYFASKQLVPPLLVATDGNRIWLTLARNATPDTKWTSGDKQIIAAAAACLGLEQPALLSSVLASSQASELLYMTILLIAWTNEAF